MKKSLFTDTNSDSDKEIVREVLQDEVENLDLFDIPQLACVIREYRNASSLSEAG